MAEFNAQNFGNALQGFSAGLQGRGGEFLQGQRRTAELERQGASDRDELMKKHMQQRQAAGQKDADKGLSFVETDDVDSLLQLTSSRLSHAEGLPNNDNGFSGTKEIHQLAQQWKAGDPAAKAQLLSRFRAAGSVRTAPAPPSAKDIAATGKLTAETAKLSAETAQIGKPKPDRPVSAKERAETKKIIAETKKLNNLSGAAPITKAEEKELEETVRANVKRISTLSQAASSRSAAVKTASKFLRAFKKGEVTSGSARKSLSFVPGVFTEQGQFDEELDSFAEVAAREKLKAVGEIRPTDADVAGMKRALFGIGRDEKTNINLLQMFIDEQESLDDELDALRASKDKGGLATFTGLQNAPIEVDF